MHWLEILRTPNADAEAYNAVVAARGLDVPTLLDHGTPAGDHPAASLIAAIESGQVRRVALVAHAGDGKSHFLRALRQSSDAGVGWNEFDPGAGASEADLLEGRWLLNDPSQLDKQAVAGFLVASFSETVGNRAGGRYVAAVNRGLLRELLPFVRSTTTFGNHASREAADWLDKALRLDEASHRPDEFGRAAVPLDRRVLVPAPGERADSLARKAAFQVFEAVRREIGSPVWDPAVWADYAAVALALVEATGHHITFRETLAHAAAVAAGLRADPRHAFPPAALQALFADEDTAPSLARLAVKLQRIDPARVATTAIDAEFPDLASRDAHVRERGWGELAAFYTSRAGSPTFPLPFRHCVEFLTLCRDLGRRAVELGRARNQLSAIGRRSIGGRSLLENLDLGALDRATVALRGESIDGHRLFQGLTQVAWGADCTADATEVLPLTTPVQPGTARGVDGWRVLRAAVSIDRASFVAGTTDLGPWIETGLTLPSLVIDGPPEAPPSPPLRLDLELYELLARMGERGRGEAADLGTRRQQVLGWLDGVVAGWEDALSESRTGFVVFQTLLGGRERGDPVPLRPPAAGPDRTAVIEETATANDVLGAVKECWPYRAAKGTTLAVTPAACASALLRWAGFVPDPIDTASPVDSTANGHPALREAAGAGGVSCLRRRTGFLSPAYPWSGHLLGVAMWGARRADSGIEQQAWIERGTLLGGACAAALGLDSHADRWRPAFRRAWADDEAAFDAHPSALLAHQWLGAGLDGRQLEAYRAEPVSLPDRGALPISARVVCSLFDPARPMPVSAAERWWLLGTWAAWWLLLRGLGGLHGLAPGRVPVLLPLVGGAGRGEYTRAQRRWFHPARQSDEVDLHALDAVAAVGQAAGFLGPSAATRNFDLALRGSTLDIVQLLAREVYLDAPGRPTERTLHALRTRLLEAGLYAQRGERPVDHRMPKDALVGEAPVAADFEVALRRALTGLGLLDQASDGATLIRAPWNEEAVR